MPPIIASSRRVRSRGGAESGLSAEHLATWNRHLRAFGNGDIYQVADIPRTLSRCIVPFQTETQTSFNKVIARILAFIVAVRPLVLLVYTWQGALYTAPHRRRQTGQRLRCMICFSSLPQFPALLIYPYGRLHHIGPVAECFR